MNHEGTMMTSTDTTPAATVTRDGAREADAAEVVTTDQATGRERARYPVAGPEEAAAATRAARATTGPWWDLGFEGRARLLRAWRREIATGGEELAALIHDENGKPAEDARAEVLAVLQHLQFAIADAERVLGRRDVPAPPTAPNQRAWLEYVPYGVVTVIGPWNFPLATQGAICSRTGGSGGDASSGTSRGMFGAIHSPSFSKPATDVWAWMTVKGVASSSIGSWSE
jgi:succinate-semialdehyde dehydrogenase/glutarate-semialdehyde dehydrogenase